MKPRPIDSHVQGSFAPDDLNIARAILYSSVAYRGKTDRTNDEEMAHRLEQIVRLAGILHTNALPNETEKRKREAQLMFNIGAASQVIEGLGGVFTWWVPFSNMYASGDMLGIANLAWKYAQDLGLILDILPPEKNN
jgi:hypothetical protein